VPFVGCHFCPVVRCPGKYLHSYVRWGLLGTVVVTGKAFCGWVCPLGFIQDVLRKIPKPKLWRHDWFRKSDAYLKKLKYLFLALVLFLIFNGLTMVAQPMRMGSNFDLGLIKLTMLSATAGFKTRLVLAAVAIGGAVVLARLWCRYLCPLGALLGFANKVSVVNLRIDKSTCTECDKCVRQCPVNTKPGTVDCTLCGDCIDRCPPQAIHSRFPSRVFKTLLKPFRRGKQANRRG